MFNWASQQSHMDMRAGRVSDNSEQIEQVMHNIVSLFILPWMKEFIQNYVFQVAIVETEKL